MSKNNLSFFCRVTAGLEEVISLDIDMVLTGLNSKELHWRRIDFTLSQNFEEVTALKGVDDVYLYVNKLKGIHHTRDMLSTIRKFAHSLDFSSFKEIIESIRGYQFDSTFYVTVSRVGKHNYSINEVRGIFVDSINANTNWKAVDDHASANLNIRVLFEHDELLVGVGIQKNPLHRRKYKICHSRGALKPPVAYLLCRIAGCQPTESLFDPMCGSGTIAIEAGLLHPSMKLIAADKSENVLRCAKQNWEVAFPETTNPFIMADVGASTIAKASIDKVICNPPWGKQVHAISIPQLYNDLLINFLHIGKPASISVFLTDRVEELMEVLQKQPQIALLWARQISLYGSYPTIFVLGGPWWVGKELGAFQKISSIGWGIDQLIEEKGMWQFYSIST